MTSSGGWYGPECLETVYGDEVETLGERESHNQSVQFQRPVQPVQQALPCLLHVSLNRDTWQR